MAIIDLITVGGNILCSVDADPSTQGNGVDAQIGSVAFHNSNGGLYIKWGTNDTDWNAINSNFKTFFSESVDGKTTGPTIIGTTRNNGSEKFYPQLCQILLISQTGFISPPTISIGTNASDYDNIINGIALSGLSENGYFYSLNIMDKVIPSLSGGSEIYLNVDTGADATTYSIRALVRGFYV